MYDEQTRINASISYLFLGPIFLLAKKDTPLAEKYVQDHAKRASLLILASIVAYGIFFAIKDILYVSFFGISLASLIAGLLITAILTVLLHGAYYAFTGKEANGIQLQNIFHLQDSQETPMNTDVSGYTDEEKIRIVASFLPFLGIYLSSQYNKEEIRLGRRIGTFFTAAILLVNIFTSSIGFSVILSLVYIGVIVTTLVGLFVQKQFLRIDFYHYIPSYRELEAHLFSTIIFSYRFIGVIFGRTKDFSYHEIFSSILEGNKESEGESVAYFMPLWIVGIPFLNLITLPSYWNLTYTRYRSLILQGFVLTFLIATVWFFYGWNSNIHSIFLFPIIHLISFASKDVSTLAPIVSLATSFTRFIKESHSKIQENIANKEEKIQFTYNTPESPEEKIANL